MLRAGLRSFASAEAAVQASNHGFVCSVTLNRPKALNSLNLPMVHDLQNLVEKWNKDTATRVTLFRGLGTMAFCAGGDVRALYNAGKGEADRSILKDFFWHEYILDYALTTMRPIQVVVYNGIVMGGGVGISIHAPIRIATEAAVFAMPETAIGFFPDVGGSFFLPRLAKGLGFYFGLTGMRLQGKQLVSAGLATHYMTNDKFDKLKEALIAKVTATSTIAEVTALVDELAEPVTEPLPQLNLIEQVFGAPKSVEEVWEKLQKMGDEWAAKRLAALTYASPLSQKVVFEQIKRGEKLSLQGCFTQEFRLSQQFVNGKDFYEGVRASLVEKDQKPLWQFKTLAEVPDALVQSYFEKLAPEQEDLLVR